MDYLIPIKYFIAGAITLLGATAHATVQWKKARANVHVSFSVTDFFILFIIATFSGVMFGVFSLIFFDDNTPVFLAAFGVGAMLGLEGLNRISIAVLERIVKEIKR